MSLVLYLLKGHEPVACQDAEAWARAFEQEDWHVAEDTLPDGTRVSTVFMGIDHSFGNGPPVLFETMIFGGEHAGHQERACTWAEAEHVHACALALARTGRPVTSVDRRVEALDLGTEPGRDGWN